METFSPSRSLREHDSNWAIMKCFGRSVGKFRVVWGSYKSGLHLAWGRNPVINLLAADTVLLSPCTRCKAHLNAVTPPFTCTWLKVLPAQASLFASQEISSRDQAHTLIWCLRNAPARPVCGAPTDLSLLLHHSCSYPLRMVGGGTQHHWVCPGGLLSARHQEKPSCHGGRAWDADSCSNKTGQIRAL